MTRRSTGRHGRIFWSGWIFRPKGRKSAAVIGAGSVVNRDIPDGVIAAGNPCRVIRRITDADRENTKSGIVRRSIMTEREKMLNGEWYDTSDSGTSITGKGA